MGYNPRGHKESGRIVRLTFHFHGLPGSSAGKNLPAMQKTWLDPGLGKSPGEGKSYPLQYSDLEKSIDCTVHGVTKSQT